MKDACKKAHRASDVTYPVIPYSCAFHLLEPTVLIISAHRGTRSEHGFSILFVNARGNRWKRLSPGWPRSPQQVQEFIERADLANYHNGKYLLISPCRDEAKYMRETLDSVINQIGPPRQMDYRR